MSDLERLQADLSDLDPEQEAALRAALAADDDLAAALVADRHTDGLLRALAAEAASGSAFVDQVAARLEAEADGATFVAGVEARLTKAPQRRAARARASGSSAWLPALLAASLLLVGGLLLAVARRPGPAESAQRGEVATPTPRSSAPAPSPSPRATPAPTPDPQPTTSPSGSSSPTPTPERTPTPTPTTAPSPPPTPEPRPTPTTQPSPTPSASPAPTPRRLDVQVAGRLRWLDGKRWRKVDADRLAWKTGQVVQASAHVLLTLPDGTTAALKKSSRVRLAGHAPITLHLEQGQVYCRVQRGTAPPRAGTRAAAPRFTVRTAEGQVDVTGTEFGVARRGSRTTVAVDAGQVVCTNPRGRVVLGAGSGARFTRSTLPKAIRLAVAPLFAWRARLAPRTRVVFAFDFENGLPGPWDVGQVRRGPPRGSNRSCLETVAKPDGATIHLAIPAEQQVRSTERVLRFRVFARSPKLAIQFKNEAYGDNCKQFVRDLPVGRWERLELPLSGFATLRSSATPAQPIRPGQRLTYLQMRVLDGPPEPSYFDAIELVEVLPR